MEFYWLYNEEYTIGFYKTLDDAQNSIPRFEKEYYGEEPEGEIIFKESSGGYWESYPYYVRKITDYGDVMD